MVFCAFGMLRFAVMMGSGQALLTIIRNHSAPMLFLKLRG